MVLTPLSLDCMKQIAAAIAQDEADAIFSYGLIQKNQQKNIQPIDVLLKVLSDRGNLQIHKWDEISPIQTNMLIVAGGKR